MFLSLGNICIGKTLEFYPSLILHASESPGDVNGVAIHNNGPAGACGLYWMLCLPIEVVTSLRADPAWKTLKDE